MKAKRNRLPIGIGLVMELASLHRLGINRAKSSDSPVSRCSIYVLGMSISQSSQTDTPDVGGPRLSAASPADLAQAIAYAMRFDDRGKPLGVGMRNDPAFMARRITDHLGRCGFVVTRGPPREPHSTG